MWQLTCLSENSTGHQFLVWNCQTTSPSIGELLRDAADNDLWGGVWGVSMRTDQHHPQFSSSEAVKMSSNSRRSAWTITSTTVAGTFSWKNSLTVSLWAVNLVNSRGWKVGCGWRTLLVMGTASCKCPTTQKTALKSQKQKMSGMIESFLLLFNSFTSSAT